MTTRRKGLAMLGKREDPTARGRTETSDPHTILGREARFVGKLTFEGAVRIDGRFEGEVETDGVLLVGPTAEIHAVLHVGSVIIHGFVEGDVIAKSSVEIKAPGRLVGNVVTPALVIEKGVLFDGTCRMARADGEASAEAA